MVTEVTTQVITDLVAFKLALALRFCFALWNADLQHFLKLGNTVPLAFSPLSDASPALHKSYFRKVSNLFLSSPDPSNAHQEQIFVCHPPNTLIIPLSG